MKLFDKIMTILFLLSVLTILFSGFVILPLWIIGVYISKYTAILLTMIPLFIIVICVIVAIINDQPMPDEYYLTGGK